MSSRAFFDDPFFTYLLPDDAMRRSRLPYFFRAVYTHMGDHGRIVTVRDEADDALGVAAWLTTGGYPLPIAVQLSQMPSSLRAFYRRPRSLLAGNRYMAALVRAHRKDPQWYLDGALRRSAGATKWRRHDAARARLRPGRRRGCRQSLGDAAPRQRRLLPALRLRTD